LTGGRPRQALQAASCGLRAGIEGSRGGGGVAYEARGYKQAGQMDGRPDGQADDPNRARSAILARISKSKCSKYRGHLYMCVQIVHADEK